jgi:CAAX amino terminal protease family.
MTDAKKYSALQIILLHLVPGLFNLIAIILLMALIKWWGYAENGRFLAGELMVVFSIVPVQIGYLLFAAKKKTNTFNILKLIPFRDKAKIVEYLLFVVIMIAWALGIDKALAPFEHGLRDSLFAFIPDDFAMRNLDFSAIPKNMLIFASCFAIFSNGIVAPITEELYFRGYLLPRINVSPFVAVVINAVLFSTYHFFSPWYFLSRILMMIPLYYWVMKRKNIRFSILAHVIANVYTSVSFLLEIL